MIQIEITCEQALCGKKIEEITACSQELIVGRNFPYTKTLRDTVVFGTPRMSHQKTKNKHQNKLQKEKSLEELSLKHKLSPGYLKRQIHAARTSLAREIKKQSDCQKSKWKFFDTLNYMKEDVLCSLKAKEER